MKALAEAARLTNNYLDGEEAYNIVKTLGKYINEKHIISTKINVSASHSALLENIFLRYASFKALSHHVAPLTHY